MPAEQAAYMAERMWIIAAQQPALHEDAARLLPRLGEVRCPVSLLEGAASPPVIGQILGSLEAGLQKARREVIDGAGHMAPVTHAKVVAERIGRFLD
jgi:pimeloyl-ACP methyl ester carboxylesterase